MGETDCWGNWVLLDQSWVFIGKTDAEVETPILATSCEELTHWKRPWCWEGLGAGRERDDRGWDGWMASPTQWTWVWVNSGSWWRTGRSAVLQFMGSQRVSHDWATELNWTESLYSVDQSCLTLCDPVDYSTPDFPVFQHLPEFSHAHLHWVGDPIIINILI